MASHTAAEPGSRLAAVDDRRLPETHLAALVEAAASITGQAGLRQVLETTVDIAMAMTGARYGALGVLGLHGTLSDFIYRGVDAGVARAIGRLPQGRGVLGYVVRTGVTVRMDRISEHPDSVGFPEHHPEMAAFLGVPVRVGGRRFGNLYLAEKEEGFTEEDESLVEALAVIAGSAVSTARLHERLQRLALIEDRERIARELHDSVIQDLFAVGLSLQTAAGQVDHDPEGVRDRILESVDRLDASISTLRRYIFDIRQRVWAQRDLGAELRAIAEQLGRPHDIEVRVFVRGATDLLDDEVIEHAVQFAREGINNALQHSGAPVVDVVVTGGRHELLVEVRDAGRGFDPAAVDRGMGLDNMRERVEHVGGTAEIESRPGAGTTVRAAIPIPTS